VAPSGPFPFDMLMRPTKYVEEDDVVSGASFALGFSVRPTALYADDTPTVAILSVQGLPLLSPSTFSVNLTEGLTVPIDFDPYYGGSTDLAMPDGIGGTLTANWLLEQLLDGTATGDVNYSSEPPPPPETSGTWKPFLGANKIQIKVVMQLRPLDFFGSGSGDNHYDWIATILVNIPKLLEQPSSKTGRSESGDTLSFLLDVTMKPPSATFTAG
jgi:hypothetical protein